MAGFLQFWLAPWALIAFWPGAMPEEAQCQSRMRAIADRAAMARSVAVSRETNSMHSV